MILETRKNLNAQSLYRTAKDFFLKKFPNPETSKPQKKSSENKVKIPIYLGTLFYNGEIGKFSR